MRKTLLFGAIGIALALSAIQAAAAPVPTQHQSWYYELGGALPVSPPANPNANTITLGAAGSLNLGYSCGRFDITATLTNMFGDLTNSIQNTLIGAAQGAIAALPLYVIQRALPGLYEMFQSYTIDFKRTFDAAVKSCEDYERDILAGKDPYAGWTAIAKGENWRGQMATGNDAVHAKQEVETTGGDHGLPWIGGDLAAGTGQAPIRAVADTVEAGWNMEHNQAPNAAGAAPATPTRLSEVFPSKADASAFAVRVLGDKIVRTHDGGAREAIAGHGLAIEIDEQREAIATELDALVASGARPTHAELDSLTSPGVGMSAKIIETLRELPADERGIMEGRLAAEIAASRAVEQILLIRRTVVTARREPNVAGNDEAQQVIEETIDEIEREVDHVMYEMRIRRELAANTASMLIARDSLMRAEGAGTAKGPALEDTHLDDGGRIQ